MHNQGDRDRSHGLIYHLWDEAIGRRHNDQYISNDSLLNDILKEVQAGSQNKY
jgi:hypothetical protein